MAAPEYLLRNVETTDRGAIIDLIDRVYQEYGDRICLQDADADLTNLPAHYLELGGQFVVLLEGTRLIGCHAAHPLPEPGVCTFRRLYLDPQSRGGQAGKLLMQWAIDWAAQKDFRRIEFWSDTRFKRAHRFFQKLGFKTSGKKRDMNDGWQDYQEFFFWMDLSEAP